MTTPNATLKPGDLAALRGHVIVMEDGRLAAKSVKQPKNVEDFKTTPADIRRIFDEDLPSFIAERPGVTVPVLVWAHGGLIDKASGFSIANGQVAWWKSNDVYPIHMVWQSGLLTSLADAIARRRPDRTRAITDVTDRVIEAAARMFGGGRVWEDMKLDAAAASGDGGGADVLIDELSRFIKANPGAISLHAVGHSAGSIFHAHFVSKALSGNPSRVEAFDTVTFLAPAVRVDTFEDTLLPLAESQQIRELSIFTMTDVAERADTCLGIYRKSLLYLVSGALEPERDAAILGMQKYLDGAGPTLRYLNQNAERLVYGPVLRGDRSSTCAKAHGDFDNDAKTMESVARRVANTDTVTPFPATAQRAAAALPPAAPASVRAASGAKRALCIGIDAYPSDPLDGAVADANAWAAMFESEGFTVERLTDAAADRDAILSAMLNAVTSAGDGDVVAIQFAGHGTFVEDVDGDERDEYGAFDEALCPVDFRAGSLILDDDLAPIWDLIPENVAVTLLFDSCHSGTASRGLPARPDPAELGQRSGRKARMVRLDAETTGLFREQRAAPLGDHLLEAARTRVIEVEPTRAANTTRNRPVVTRREVLVSACLPNEVAWETGGQGVFTRAALAVLADDPGVTSRGLVDRVVTNLGPNRDQTPKLTADAPYADRVLLGTAVATPIPSEPPAPRAADVAEKRTAAIVAILRATADLLEADDS